jgi:hypothetical protein
MDGLSDLSERVLSADRVYMTANAMQPALRPTLSTRDLNGDSSETRSRDVIKSKISHMIRLVDCRKNGARGREKLNCPHVRVCTDSWLGAGVHEYM